MRPPASNPRWKVLGGVALALLALYLVLLHWWYTAPMLEMGAEIRALNDQEQEWRAQIAQRPQLQARLAQVRQFESANPGFLPEGSRELASAGLVQRLQQVVATASPNQNACRITAQTPTEMPTQEPFPRVVVGVRLQCGMTELAAVLHALEAGSPQLFIDNLDLLSRNSYLNTPGDTSAGMDVSFDLYGYLKAPQPRAAGGRRG